MGICAKELREWVIKPTLKRRLTAEVKGLCDTDVLR